MGLLTGQRAYLSGVVRKAGRHSSQDVHRALFAEKPAVARTLDELKDGIRRHVRRRHARR
jgi:hypothetical protein